MASASASTAVGGDVVQALLRAEAAANAQANAFTWTPGMLQQHASMSRDGRHLEAQAAAIVSRASDHSSSSGDMKRSKSGTLCPELFAEGS